MNLTQHTAQIISSAYSYFFSGEEDALLQNNKTEKSLADLSALLLLILSHHTIAPFQGYSGSLYRKQLAYLRDIYGIYATATCNSCANITAVDPDEREHDGTSPPVRISFKSLYDVLCGTMSEDSSIILLYLLIHSNRYFLSYVLSRTDFDTLVGILPQAID